MSQRPTFLIFSSRQCITSGFKNCCLICYFLFSFSFFAFFSFFSTNVLQYVKWGKKKRFLLCNENIAIDYILMKRWDNKQFWHAAWCAEDRHKSKEISAKMVSNRVLLVSEQDRDQESMCFHMTRSTYFCRKLQ